MINTNFFPLPDDPLEFRVPTRGERVRLRGRLRGPILLSVLIGWLLLALGPYLAMVVTSFTPQDELVVHGISRLPSRLTIQGYLDLFFATPFRAFLINSILTSLSTVSFGLIIASAGAISFSRFRFRGRTAVLSALLVAQLIPAVVLVVPLSSIMRQAHLLNTRTSLVLVYLTFATPFATHLLKSFLDAIPRELDEAAAIDGCSSIQMVWYILLPLLRPGLAAAATYLFIFSWNEFLFALTFTSTVASQPIPVGLQLFIGDYQIRWDLLSASGVVAAVPVIVIFMLMQRQLLGGLTAGGVKY